jgi:ATP-dependent RNA/DNA helicase IGHMBP2
LRSELKSIQKEVVQREKVITEGIIKNAKIVFATCVGASSYLLRNNTGDANSSTYPFDYAIIDEAAQGLEASCWIPIQLSRKTILAGDHCQLPPTIKSKEAEQGGLSITLFEKIITDARFNKISNLLNIQYRMNDLINSWASENMYEGKVISHESVKDHTLKDLLPGEKKKEQMKNKRHEEGEDELGEEEEEENSIPVLMMIDTSNAYMYEDDKNTSDGKPSQSQKKSTSHRNQNEAELILQQTLYLVRKGIKPSDIGIITPYNGQLELLKEIFAPYFSNYVASSTSSSNSSSHINSPSVKESLDGLDIKTIDGFQGGEKECILITFVRSNESKNVGFLGENRRINVAITRAKRHLTIVCDSETCRTDSFIATLIEHMEDNGEIIPAEFYLTEFLMIQNTSGLSSSSAAALKEKILNKSSKAASKTVPPAPQSAKDRDNYSQKKNNNEDSNKFDNDIDTKKHEAIIQQFSEILKKYKNYEISGGQLVYKKEAHLLDYDHLLPTNSPEKQQEIRPLIFPNNLNNYLRMNIHELATNLSLYHESFGEKKKRFMMISLNPFQTENLNPPAVPEKELNVEPSVPEQSTKEDKSENEEDSDEEEDEEEEKDKTQPKASLPSDSVSSKKKKSKNKSKDKKKGAGGAHTLGTLQSNPHLASLSTANIPADVKDLDDEAFLALQIEQNRVSVENICVVFLLMV